MKALNQKGSLHLGLILAVVVVAAIAFAGYRVWNGQNSANNEVAASQSSVPTSIKNKADLAATGKVLDADNAQLDSSLNDDALNGDINSML